MTATVINGQRVGDTAYAAKAADYTVTENDSGTVFYSTAADVVFTLPATAEGLTYTFVTGAVSASTGTSVAPAAADQILGNGFTVADDKAAINTGATDVLGDAISVVGNGTTGWVITNVIGTWARET